MGLALMPLYVHAEEAELPEIQVVGQAAGSYKAPVSRAATRIPMELKDVPQTVNVVNQALIRDQNATSFQDALANVVGIGQSVGDGQRDQITIRGFSAITDQFVDGVRDDSLYFRDLSNVEHIEVLKGPASVLYGRGSAGGLINRVTKKPTLDPVQTLGFQFDEFGQKRAEIDLGVAGESAQFRVTGAYEDSEGFRKQSFIDREAVAPSLMLNLSERTKLLLQADYLHDRRLADQGVPRYLGAPVDVPIETYYGSANGKDETYVDTDVKSQTATLEHEFSADTRFKQLVRHYEFDLARNYTTNVVNEPAKKVTVRHTRRLRDESGWFSQTELTHGFNALGARHELLAGLEVGKQDKAEIQWRRAASSLTTYDLFNPRLVSLGAPPSGANPDINNANKVDIAALYLQDLISAGRWKFLAGLRFDRIRQKRDDLTSANVDLDRTDNVWSPRAGVVYEVTPSTSLYASASRSFQPLADSFTFKRNSDDLKPEQTDGFEVGAKSDLLDGKASATLALFQIEKKNMLSGDPTDPTNRFVPIGRQQSRGVELSLAGQVLPGLEASAGYAYLDAVIKEARDSDGKSLDGKRPSLAPRHTANVWLKQSLGNDFYGTAGVRYVDERFASSTSNIVRLPAYTVGDIGLIYQGKRFEANLMLKNVADVKYYVSAHGAADDYNMPGAPRTLSLSTRFHF
ncbi:TonB-dependent receptor [Crenobacter cavernae]|uniref:TonB-dependent receptor n=1 Tax=Crenobacter cavernae TaxID=2290923 RepID=UPI0015F173D3|nr:TonB-dependent siderophore receptor [Crenobacter cavernae]